MWNIGLFIRRLNSASSLVTNFFFSFWMHVWETSHKGTRLSFFDMTEQEIFFQDLCTVHYRWRSRPLTCVQIFRLFRNPFYRNIFFNCAKRPKNKTVASCTLFTQIRLRITQKLILFWPLYIFPFYMLHLIIFSNFIFSCLLDLSGVPLRLTQ
jgi:hypothetical protein